MDVQRYSRALPDPFRDSAYSVRVESAETVTLDHVTREITVANATLPEGMAIRTHMAALVYESPPTMGVTRGEQDQCR
jgi:hypothetical protein